MLGWHVHEKAVLMILIPFSLTAVDSRLKLQAFSFLNANACLSLFPLLFRPQEFLLKCFLWLSYQLALHSIVKEYIDSRLSRIGPSQAFLYWLQKRFVFLMIPLIICTEILMPVFLPQLEFLPLLCISCYCAIGNLISWRQSWEIYWLDLQLCLNYDE
jgi:alpha-1,3-glucosyltransferase